VLSDNGANLGTYWSSFTSHNVSFFVFISADNIDTALFSGVYPSVASDRSYYFGIIIVCDINRPKLLVCIQNAGNEKFRSNIEIAKMNGNTFFCVRDLKLCMCVSCACVPTIFTSKSYIYILLF